jgi:hypothetical protein
MMAHGNQLPVQPISGRAGLIAEVQTSMTLLQPDDHPADGRWIGTDLAQVSDLTLPTLVGNCHSVTGSGRIHPDKNFAILIHGLSPCAEEKLAHANNPR